MIDPRYQDQALARMAQQIQSVMAQQQADIEGLKAELDSLRAIEQEGIWLPFSAYQLNTYSQSATGLAFALTVPRDLQLVEWHQSIYVAGTNNGSNYWSVSLKRVSDSAELSTFNTSAMSAATWTRNSNAGLSIDVTTAHLGLYISVSKTGSPGNWSMVAPAVLAH